MIKQKIILTARNSKEGSGLKKLDVFEEFVLMCYKYDWAKISEPSLWFTYS